MAREFSGLSWMPADAITNAIAPFEIIHTYGLFAVMTTTRPEIIIEGSNDAQNWLPYEFKYKMGALGREPRWVAPHQPCIIGLQQFGDRRDVLHEPDQATDRSCLDRG